MISVRLNFCSVAFVGPESYISGVAFDKQTKNEQALINHHIFIHPLSK